MCQQVDKLDLHSFPVPCRVRCREQRILR
jgi:hypothetical protein